MSLSRCVKTVLCGLSAAVRRALNDLITTYIASIDAFILSQEAYLVYLDVLTVVPRTLSVVAEEALVQARAGANLIPLNLVGDCLDIGNINITIVDTIETLIADVKIVASELTRLLSLRDEVEARIAELRALRDQYVEVQNFIEECET